MPGKPKGLPKTGGRKAGTPNAVTTSFKRALEAAYKALQDESGSEHGDLIAWARENKTEFYRIKSKLLPIQVEGNPDNPIEHNVTVKLVRPDFKD